MSKGNGVMASTQPADQPPIKHFVMDPRTFQKISNQLGKAPYDIAAPILNLMVNGATAVFENVGRVEDNPLELELLEKIYTTVSLGRGICPLCQVKQHKQDHKDDCPVGALKAMRKPLDPEKPTDKPTVDVPAQGGS